MVVETSIVDEANSNEVDEKAIKKGGQGGGNITIQKGFGEGTLRHRDPHAYLGKASLEPKECSGYAGSSGSTVE